MTEMALNEIHVLRVLPKEATVLCYSKAYPDIVGEDTEIWLDFHPVSIVPEHALSETDKTHPHNCFFAGIQVSTCMLKINLDLASWNLN